MVVSPVTVLSSLGAPDDYLLDDDDDDDAPGPSSSSHGDENALPGPAGARFKGLLKFPCSHRLFPE